MILAPPVADSRLVVVRGEPCTGTSRAAWEAVAELLAEWPLEYPRTAAALAARLQAGIPAGTVLWLGELGRYADVDGAATALRGLDDLLDEDGYLVVATIWPWQWDACIAAVGAGRGAGDPAWLAGRMLARLDELSLYDPSSISPGYGGGFLDVPAGSPPANWPRRPGAAIRCWLSRRPRPGRMGGSPSTCPGSPGCCAATPALVATRGPAVLTAAMDASRFGLTGPLLADPAGAGGGRRPARSATRRRPGERGRAGGCTGYRAGRGRCHG